MVQLWKTNFDTRPYSSVVFDVVQRISCLRSFNDQSQQAEIIKTENLDSLPLSDEDNIPLKIKEKKEIGGKEFKEENFINNTESDRTETLFGHCKLEDIRTGNIFKCSESLRKLL